jgi:tol-pal system protein YbgF
MSRRLRLAVLLAALPLAASAGVFDDDEARKQITDLRLKTEDRFDNSARAQLDLARQIEALRAEIAKLRGQNEVLTFELEAAQKRQRDFYIDLDTRLRKIEPPPVTEAPPAQADAAAKPKLDPAAEARDYEAALTLFKQGKYKETLAALEAFMKQYGDGTMAPSAQYWLGNTHYALRDCKKAIEAQNVVVAKWPSSPKAPDALLGVATCQQELGLAASARKTLEGVVAKYPGTPAADSAKTRLKKK